MERAKVKSNGDKWCLVSDEDTCRTFCDGTALDAFADDEYEVRYFDQRVSKQITCPECILKIKVIQSIKL